MGSRRAPKNSVELLVKTEMVRRKTEMGLEAQGRVRLDAESFDQEVVVGRVLT